MVTHDLRNQLVGSGFSMTVFAKLNWAKKLRVLVPLGKVLRSFEGGGKFPKKLRPAHATLDFETISSISALP